MKRTLFICVLTVFTIITTNAQKKDFRLGVHLGNATGKFSDLGYEMNLGLDASYMHKLSKDWWSIGISSGYSLYTGESVGNDVDKKVSTVGYIPIAASVEYLFKFPSLYLGADLGYAFLTGNDADGGGIYYQPKIGYYSFKHRFYISYKGITDKNTISSFRIGYTYLF